jgi:hypothetical protein
MRLSRDEHGVEVWLDLHTGQELTGEIDRESAPALHPLIAKAAVALTERGLGYLVRTDRHVCCPLSGKEASYLLCCTAYEDWQGLMCTSELPVRVPEDARGRAVEYLNRVNYLLRCGNFELGHGDGEVRFRMSIDVSGGALTPELVGNLIEIAIPSCNRYFRGLMDVVFAGKAPSEAIAEAE